MTTRAAFDVSGSFMAETLTLAGLPMKGAPGARRRLATGDFCRRNWRQQPFQVECSLAAMRGRGLGGKGIYISTVCTCAFRLHRKPATLKLGRPITSSPPASCGKILAASSVHQPFTNSPTAMKSICHVYSKRYYIFLKIID